MILSDEWFLILFLWQKSILLDTNFLTWLEKSFTYNLNTREKPSIELLTALSVLQCSSTERLNNWATLVALYSAKIQSNIDKFRFYPRKHFISRDFDDENLQCTTSQSTSTFDYTMLYLYSISYILQMDFLYSNIGTILYISKLKWINGC